MNIIDSKACPKSELSLIRCVFEHYETTRASSHLKSHKHGRGRGSGGGGEVETMSRNYSKRIGTALHPNVVGVVIVCHCFNDSQKHNSHILHCVKHVPGRFDKCNGFCSIQCEYFSFIFIYFF